MKLSPKSNQGFICERIWVKPLSKSMITMKESLLKFTVVLFLGKLIFSGVQGHSYAIFKTLRRPDKTWNFACSITRVSTHLMYNNHLVRVRKRSCLGLEYLFRTASKQIWRCSDLPSKLSVFCCHKLSWWKQCSISYMEVPGLLMWRWKCALIAHR